jgi:hypothetical protein
MTETHLGAGVHFFPIFLVHEEDDGDAVSDKQEVGAGEF